MPAYRNITVNLSTPTTKVDFAADAVLSILLAAAPGRVLASDLDAAILASGADPEYRDDAVRALRNMGYGIECDKARHLSSWWIDPSPIESEVARNRRIREGYSLAVGNARSLEGQLNHNPGNPVLVANHRRWVQLAIEYGTDVAMGMSIQQVIDDCVPLRHVP